jgi:hypothetical protein
LAAELGGEALLGKHERVVDGEALAVRQVIV